MIRKDVLRRLLLVAVPLVSLAALIGFWNWDWFIPLAERRASAVLGRPVTIGHLHVHPGRAVSITADDAVIGNPPNWTGDPLAKIQRLTVEVKITDYLIRHTLTIPLIDIEGPHVNLAQKPDGSTNYSLGLAGKSNQAINVGMLRISSGEIRAILTKLKTDMRVDVATRNDRGEEQLVATAHGTYGQAPIDGRMIGGAVLSLRNSSQPWPVDLKLQNGQTKVSLVGTLQDPLHFTGADLGLQLAGQDLGQLEKMTGIPLPKTPPFNASGHLDFANGRVQFRDFLGRLGSSDLEGSLDVDPGKDRPEVIANLRSRRVDLADLGGLVGTEPGRIRTPGQSRSQREELGQSESKPRLLPTRPLSVPTLHWADLHLRYFGQHIEGESVPLDNLEAELVLENGRLTLHPVSIGVGRGRIKGNIALKPQQDKLIHAIADIDLQNVDVSRLMAATHRFKGTGLISGTGAIDATGSSLAQMLAHGHGDVRMGMIGGNLSAVLIDLSGLEFGNSLLSALGMPERTPVKCLVTELPLVAGVLYVRSLSVDTGEALVNGRGSINLKDEAVDMLLRTEAKHFSIGSLPAPILIKGTLKHPSIRPGAEMAVRGGLAGVLAALFPPLALLPTIQFGIGEQHQCERILAYEKHQPGGQRLPSPSHRTRR